MSNLYKALLENIIYWLVVYTNPNREIFVHGQLINNNFDTYLPLTKITRNSIPFTIPLFSRYLFVKQTPRQNELHNIRGITGLITIKDEPALIRDQSIQELKSRHNTEGIIETQLPQPTFPQFVPNEIIKIVYGVHAGCTGEFLKLTNKHRAEILLPFGGAQRKVNIPISSIHPVY